MALAGVAICFAGTVDYQYDELGRLRKVIRDDGKVTDYSLDLAGNRTNVNTSFVALLQFSAPTYSVGESGGTATITVSRTGSTTGAVSVGYATSNGTATAGSDYTATSGTLNWAANDSAAKTFTIAITDDSTLESNETINVALTTPGAGAALGLQSTAVLTITDNDTPMLQFSSATYSVGEGGGTATITVNRTGSSSGAVGVSYATTTGGTATAGSDYTTRTGTLSWASGVTGAKTFTIPITDDTAIESAETVNLALTSPTGGATLGLSAAQLTITDNDVAMPGTIQLVSSTATVTEGTTTVSLTARRTNGTTGAVSAVVNTANGTATSGSDYTAIVNGAVSWSAGDSADKTITVTIANDSAYELAETFSLALSSPTGGATLGALTSATVTINDNDQAPAFSITSTSVAENAASVTLTITKTNATSLTHAVTYATANGSATSGSDYTAISATQVSFAPADTSKTVTVSLLDDGTYEGPTETFTVTLSGATNNATIPAGTATATVTINENESPPSFTISNASVNEGSSTTLTVTKSGTTSLTHNVTYTAIPGTADVGADYTDILATVMSFLPGETTKTINVNALVDPVLEPAETYRVALSNPTNSATVVAGGGVVTINDTNAVTFSVQPKTQAENSGSMTFTITKDGTTTLDHSIVYQTEPGTATAGSDYTHVGGSFTFAPGDTTKTFSVPILTDNIYEGTETFGVRLSSPTNGATVPTPVVTNSITDLNPPQFEVTSAQYGEGAGTVSVTITKSGNTALTHRVTYSTGGGTATSGSDYAGFSGFVDFAPADTSKTVSLTITDDSTVEGNETIIPQLSISNGGYTLQTGVLTILDNEAANTININNVNFEGSSGGSSTSASYTLTGSGDIVAGGDCRSALGDPCPGGDIGDWISPKSNFANYQVRATQQGPQCQFMSGTYNTWLASVAGTWGSTVPDGQSTTCNVLLEIRAIANPSVILDTATIYFNLYTGL
ncbi:MAG TPA: Calx-beta domain-containing protein [Steroidobacteraceae bacterium]|nr:Calx-beta domain-containing protein [Steroidobacteraceae bacterium]